jgi:hypothetical protein
MPTEWDNMSLKHIKAFGADFDVTVTRKANGKLGITILSEGGKAKKYVIKEGQTTRIKL